MPTTPPARLKPLAREARLAWLVQHMLSERERKIVAALSLPDRAHLEASLLSLEPTAEERAADKLDFLRQPPTMEEFIRDDYYLGKTLRRNEDSVGLFPSWYEILVRDFSYESAIHNAVLTGALGIGKCWNAGTYMIMFDGSTKKVEHIEVGDLLMGDDSTPRKVLSTTRGRGPMFEIYPVKGEAFTVNGDHILVLKATNSNEVEEVSVNDFLKWPREKRHKACLFRTAVDWAEQPVPIDPYIFGLWLGDGHTCQTALTTADEELGGAWIDYGKSLGLAARVFEASKGNKAGSIQLSYLDETGTLRKGKNELRNRLKSLGFIATIGLPIAEKFIPACYTANSRKNRLELLAGLIDTDGSLGSSNGTYEITFKLKKLSDQTRFLAQSLGYYARTSVKVVNSTAYYRTIISGAYDIPVRLARKKSGLKPETRLSNLTGGVVNFDNSKSRFAVTPVGEDDYYGFTLTGDGRCLLKDFTVTHNTFTLVIILLYRIVLTTLLRTPQHHFGLSRGSSIIFNILSVTREQVRQTAFGDAINFMSASPYFLEEMQFNPDMEYAKSIVPFRNNIYLTAGSKGWHVLGRNVLGIAMDEGNFRLEKDPDKKAYILFDQVRTRLANRFQKFEGILPAISILASSASDESSFTETVIKDIEKVNDPTTQVVYRQPVYAAKRHELTLGRRWFKVAHGLRNQDPCLLTGWHLEDGTPLPEEGTVEEPPKGARTELVPEMYLPDFRRNCRSNLQSISGISVGGSHRLFSSLIDLERCLELSEAAGVPNPMKANVRFIPVSVEDELNIWDYLAHSKFLTRVQSRVQPLRHPNALRYAHLDLATVGKAGLSICHLAGAQKVEGVIRDGHPFDEYRLIVEYDFILTITAGQAKPINFEKICNFFYWLRDMCGYRFYSVTADQFQCLAGGTLVNTSRGLLPIENVTSGDTVKSRQGPAKVLSTCLYRRVQVLKITTNHGNVIVGTPNHRIEADLAYCRWKPPAWQWARLDKLAVGDYVHMVQEPVGIDCQDARLLMLSGKACTGQCLLQKWQPPAAVNSVFAEWLGLMWGDGHVRSKRAGRSQGRIELTAHTQDAECAKAAIHKLFGFRLEGRVSRSKKSVSLGFSCRHTARWLELNGFTKPAIKAKNGYKGEYGLPTAILESSRASKAAFLRGLFSADGSVCALTGAVTLSTKHRQMAEEVMILLRTEFGIASHLVKSLRTGFGKRRVQFIVNLGGSRLKFFEQIGFCYGTKQTLLQRHTHRPGRHIRTRIAKIEHGMADVYDLHVEGDHSYTANGFVSHNSTMPLQNLEARGFKVDKLSIDRDKSAYTAWRTGFEDLRIRLYRSEEMMEEAEKLMEGDKKFDHPENGSKDTTDSASGSYMSAISSDERTTLLTQSIPSVYGQAPISSGSEPDTLVDIPLPSRTLRRVKEHTLR